MKWSNGTARSKRDVKIKELEEYSRSKKYRQDTGIAEYDDTDEVAHGYWSDEELTAGRLGQLL
ncbi:MAG: hypothetical protein FRX48_02409 [Lasallia pustulata]|uniref:Uncharacterized protein n=1 Tax=Lasallia pustulata TaxID=136370 RepID=A0A5M8PWQ0_9LECA|nr:MAG: hypothetical protein FRX48_02409 [Lasallia pustulata]